MRIRAFLAGAPTRVLLLVTLLSVVLSLSSALSAVEPFASAQECADDWNAAIAAREAGAAGYSGPCANFGGFGPADPVPEDFRQIAEEWRVKARAELASLTTDPWGLAGRHLAGLPLVLYSLLVGALMTGIMLGSGTAAWAVSNGWTRPIWILSAIASTMAVVVSAYLVLSVGFVWYVYGVIRTMGSDLSPGLPGSSLALPLAGLGFYAMAGIGAGLLARRGETAAVAVIAIAGAELVLSRILGPASILPSALLQVANGTNQTLIDPLVAAAGLAAAAVSLAAILYLAFVDRLDLPDRPT